MGMGGVWPLYLSAYASMGAENKTDDVEAMSEMPVAEAAADLSCCGDDDCCDEEEVASMDCCVF